MAHKLTGPPSFVEAFFAAGRGGEPAVRAHRADDRLGAVVGAGEAGAVGGLGPAVVSAAGDAEALLLQRWYSLSDEGLEEALFDRLSFRRFCGFALDDETPDAKTICRFRLALVAAEVPERLFAELDRQLAAKGLFVRSGTLIDATLIDAT
jgi:hypothetical protein